MLSRLCAAAAWASAAAVCQASDVADASALAQASVRVRRGGPAAGEAVADAADAPIVNTKLGPVRGVKMDGYNVFKKIPYVEPPERYAAAEPKRPWGPAVLDATEFGSGCIGTHVPGVTESEDCLSLNIWLPPGEHTKMPVVVYFHGGMNQHGAGREPARQGDILVQASQYPAVFVNFDFRMGVLGYYYDGTPDNSGVPLNLGLRDQQHALRWVNEHIAAFGGDPDRVTLLGMSFGCPNILAHMVAPGSANLFSRAALISPPADMWLRNTNQLRTDFIRKAVGCKKPDGWSTLRCLKRKNAQKLWEADWISEDLSRDMFSKGWWHNAKRLLSFFQATHISGSELPGHLGWHTVVDNETMPGEPRDLIQQGRWHKVPVLLTTVRNESLGIFPGGSFSGPVVDATAEELLGKASLALAKDRYQETLRKQGIRFDELSLKHALVSDKVWTCDARSLARDVATTGGTAFMGLFNQGMTFDPVNNRTNDVCQHGATCHSSDSQFLLPQGRGEGLIGLKGSEEDAAFAMRYRDYFLQFVSGLETPWKEYKPDEEAITFIDAKETRVVPGYRREQCDVLDQIMSPTMPVHMQRTKSRVVAELHRSTSAPSANGA